jgi:hypothetical protein
LHSKIDLHKNLKSNTMKMFKKLLFAGLAFATLNVSAQTADEVIAKNIEAMGGAAKLESLNTVKRTGSMSMQGMDIPMVFTVSHLKGFRLDVELMGTSNYQIITPEKAFMFFPIQQMTEPKEMEADQVKEMQSALDLRGSMLGYKEKGTSVELIGKEKIDGGEAFKIKVTRKDGKSSFNFYDAKTFRLAKTIAKGKGQDGVEADIETPFSDYKQNADGYWFAYTTGSPMGTIVFEKIESNVKVDESIFKP